MSKELKVSRIQIEGNELLSKEQILSRFRIHLGRPFHPRVFENDIDGLLCFYEDNGYPFCQIKPHSFQLEAGQLSLALRIEEGPLVGPKPYVLSACTLVVSNRFRLFSCFFVCYLPI